MTTEEIKTLPTEEKLQIMAVLWEDMRHRFESCEISTEVLSLVRERRARVARGDSRLLDWDAVKFTIGRG